MANDKVGWRIWVAATRPFAFPASLVAVLTGTAAAAGVRDWRWGVLTAELFAVALMHGIGNLLNDYFDYRSGVDCRTEDDEGRPGRFLVKGILSPRQVLQLAVLLAVPLPLLGGFLIWTGGWPVVALAAAGLIGAYVYTGPPFALKYRGLGELCIFVVYGPAIMVGAAYMQLERVDPRVLLYSIPVGMLTTAILAANNLRDVAEDGQARIATLAQLLGRRAYLAFYLALMFGPAVLIAAMVTWGTAPGWALMSLCAIPLAVGPTRCALRGIRQPNADAMTAGYATAFDALLFVGLVLSASFRKSV